MKNKKIYVTAILTLFNFVFLGTEYLFIINFISDF